MNLCFGHGLLVALSENSQDLPKSRQLTVWRVNSATDIEHLVDLPVSGDEDQKRTTNVAMDESYIAVFLQSQQATKMYFMSTESLRFKCSRRMKASGCRTLRYHRGFLIMQNKNCIR